MTLAHTTIVHMLSAFTPGLLYVMLSRVTSTSHLKIVGRLRPSLFVPVRIPGLGHPVPVPTAN